MASRVRLRRTRPLGCWSPVLAALTGKPHALMWSGGKDSALALDRARRSGLDVARLISFYDSATGRVRFHATRVEMLEAQAKAIGIDLQAVPSTWPEMDATLNQRLAALRDEGFAGVVFGDIHLADVREGYEGRVRGAGMGHVARRGGGIPATRRPDLGRASARFAGRVHSLRCPGGAHMRGACEAGSVLARTHHRRTLRRRDREDGSGWVRRERRISLLRLRRPGIREAVELGGGGAPPGGGARPAGCDRR